jgi:chromosome segregation ATPase
MWPPAARHANGIAAGVRRAAEAKMRSLLSLLVEPAMYVAIGFLAAALLSLPLFGVAHRRAERLTRQRLDMLLPMSVKELEAGKDLLRAEHAMSEQRLEATLADLKAKTTAQQIELGRHSGAVAQLKAELGDRAQAIAALEARDATLKQQLRALEQEHALQAVHLDDARCALRDKDAELARVSNDLATRSVIAEQQNVELATTRAEMAALEAAAQDDERERNALNARLARSREEIDAAGRQLADEGRKVEDLTQEHAVKSALLDEARAALREQEAELARFATDFATGADIIGQQDLELAKARAEAEALKLESEALRAQLARHGDEADAADRRLARQRGKADDLDRRAADLEAELIAQREAADALTHITAARVCEQARRLAEQEHEVERLQAALDAARRAEAGLRYELTRVEERRMLESRAALAEKAALEIQVARLQLDREQRQLEVANGTHANGATNRHGAPDETHVVRLDPIAMRERRAREEPAAPHPGAN